MVKWSIENYGYGFDKFTNRYFTDPEYIYPIYRINELSLIKAYQSYIRLL